MLLSENLFSVFAGTRRKVCAAQYTEADAASPSQVVTLPWLIMAQLFRQKNWFEKQHVHIHSLLLLPSRCRKPIGFEFNLQSKLQEYCSLFHSCSQSLIYCVYPQNQSHDVFSTLQPTGAHPDPEQEQPWQTPSALFPSVFIAVQDVVWKIPLASLAHLS